MFLLLYCVFTLILELYSFATNISFIIFFVLFLNIAMQKTHFSFALFSHLRRLFCSHYNYMGSFSIHIVTPCWVMRTFLECLEIMSGRIVLVIKKKVCTTIWFLAEISGFKLAQD